MSFCLGLMFYIDEMGTVDLIFSKESIIAPVFAGSGVQLP